MGIEKDKGSGVEVLSFSKEEMWSLLDGRLHVLHEGRDYPVGCAFEDIRKRMRQGAWRRGVTVKIVNMGGSRVMIQSTEDANEHREAIRADTKVRPEPTPDEIEKQDLMNTIGDLQLQVQDLELRLSRSLREFSTYRLEHPIR